MALVKVDITDVIANVTRSLPRRTDMQRFQRELGSKAYAYWEKLASEGLTSSSRDYIQALSHRSTENREFIVLVGQLPNMIENGFKGGDMRDWMLKGPKAKMGKNGMYNTVPFRHGSKDTTGRNVGPEMPSVIYNAAKKLDGTKSKASRLTGSKGSSVLYGKRLEPTMRGISKQVKDALNTKKQDWHTTSIYTGMQRSEKKYEKASQTGGYTTFRRISRNSKDPRSWFHPGIKAKHFAPKVRDRIEQIAPHLMRQLLGGT